MHKIYPLVLCGGMGSRLWPMSRIEQPKQFQPVGGKDSLTYFQTTVQRHRGPQFHDPIVVTNHRHAELVRQQLDEIQCGGLIIGEPVARNTGPAVLAAALKVLCSDLDALLLVLPADHIILGDLNATILQMAGAAAGGHIVTFGVAPGYAETGYGYIIDGGPTGSQDGLHLVERFVEKPAAHIAQSLIDSGRAYWASGISLFSAKTISAEFKRLDPETHAAVLSAVMHARKEMQGITLEEGAFRRTREEPTERAVFEHSSAVRLAPIKVKWDDIGAWASVYDVNLKSEAGNVTTGDVLAIDTTNSLIRSDGRLVVVVGLDDVIVVDTKDALLVTDRAHAQKVKQVVEALKSSGRPEVVSHVYQAKSWGGIEDLLSAAGFKLEMLTIRPGSTAQINGHGLGASFLSVVTGEGSFMEDHAWPGRALPAGGLATADGSGPDLPGAPQPAPAQPGPDLPGPDLPGPDLPGTDLPGPNAPGDTQPGVPQPDRAEFGASQFRAVQMVLGQLSSSLSVPRPRAARIRQSIGLGAMLSIDKNTQVSLTNTQSTNLQALLLSTGQHLGAAKASRHD